MGSLERVISNLPSQYPSQGQQSPYPTQLLATPQVNQPSQVQPWAYQAPQEAPTYATNASPTQASYPASTEQPQNHGLSAASAEVVNHFGVEAPGILNQYSCTLEDMLMSQAERMDALNERASAMQTILTDPDHLANYTDRFFTEVFPVEIDGDQSFAGQPQQYQPNYDMPAPPAAAGGRPQGAQPQQQWEAFSEVMNRSPENAWRYLSQMQPEALRSKLLFMEGA
jgi:hypothetical protein